MMFNVEEIYKSDSPDLILCSIVIGDSYLKSWENNSKNNWIRYCSLNNYSLYIITSVDLEVQIKPTWYKYLVPKALKQYRYNSQFVAVIDADQVFSPISPPLLNYCKLGSIGVVPMIDNYERTISNRKLISFLRKNHISQDYPLDSTMLAVNKHKSGYGFNPYINEIEISTGFYLVPSDMNEVYENIFLLSQTTNNTFTDGGDQLLATREIFRHKYHFIDSKWQGIWPDIMASSYANLYLGCSNEEASVAVANSLFSYYCIHFATSWPEKDFWNTDSLSKFDELIKISGQRELNKYLGSSINTKEYGRLKSPDVKLIKN